VPRQPKPLTERCRALHREQPELTFRELAEAVGTSPSNARYAVMGKSKVPPQPSADPPRVDRGCIHEQAHTLRYMFAFVVRYQESRDGLGYYQQWARRDALDMALAERPIPECKCKK